MRARLHAIDMPFAVFVSTHRGAVFEINTRTFQTFAEQALGTAQFLRRGLHLACRCHLDRFADFDHAAEQHRAALEQIFFHGHRRACDQRTHQARSAGRLRGVDGVAHRGTGRHFDDIANLECRAGGHRTDSEREGAAIGGDHRIRRCRIVDARGARAITQARRQAVAYADARHGHARIEQGQLVLHKVTDRSDIFARGFLQHQPDGRRRRIERNVVVDHIRVTGCEYKGQVIGGRLRAGGGRRLRLHREHAAHTQTGRVERGRGRNLRRRRGVTGGRRHRQCVAACGRAVNQQELIETRGAGELRQIRRAAQQMQRGIETRRAVERYRGTGNRLPRHRIVDHARRIERQTLLNHVVAGLQLNQDASVALHRAARAARRQAVAGTALDRTHHVRCIGFRHTHTTQGARKTRAAGLSANRQTVHHSARRIAELELITDPGGQSRKGVGARCIGRHLPHQCRARGVIHADHEALERQFTAAAQAVVVGIQPHVPGQ